MVKAAGEQLTSRPTATAPVVDSTQIPPLAIHADPNRLGFQSSQKIRAGKLNPLIGIENFRPPMLLHGLAQRRHAEIRIHRNRHPPRQEPGG